MKLQVGEVYKDKCDTIIKIVARDAQYFLGRRDKSVDRYMKYILYNEKGKYVGLGSPEKLSDLKLTKLCDNCHRVLSNPSSS